MKRTALFILLTLLFAHSSSAADNRWFTERWKMQLDPATDPRLLRSLPNEYRPTSPQSKILFGENRSVQMVDSGSNLRINDPQLEEAPRVQNGTSSAVSGNSIVVAYNDIGTKYSAVSFSNDYGRTWQQTFIPQLANGQNFGSGVVAARAGIFYYAGVSLASNNRSLIIFSRSVDGGRTWSEPLAVFPQNVVGVVQEKPWIAVDNTDTATAGHIYIGWTEIRNTGSRIVLAVSRDQGATFADVFALTQFDGSFSVQGIAIAVAPDGDAYIAWGDSRTKGIRFIRGTNGGRSFSQIFNVASFDRYELLGPLLNSHFAANGLPSIAVDNSRSIHRGKIYITFNARPSDKPADKADVFLVSSTDKGSTWSAPLRVNDSLDFTDQFMPSVAVDRDGAVGLMWYDRRNDPIYNAMLDVYGAVSTDGGQTFSKNRRITSGNWLLIPTPVSIRANYHGDYNQMSALTDSAGFFFNWGDDRSGLDADVYTAQYATASFAESEPDLIVSPVRPSQSVVAGQGAQLEFTVSKRNLTGGLQYGVTSDDPSIEFVTEALDNGDTEEVKILARTTAATPVGTHPVLVSVGFAGIIRTATLRLNVLPAGQLQHLPLNISKTTGRSVQPHVAFDKAGGLNVVWSDDTSGNFNVYFSRSADGSSFTEPVLVSQTRLTCINPQVALDAADQAHIVWQECDQNGVCRIYYSRSAGASFSTPKLLSAGFEFSELPSLVVNGQNVLVFWNGVRSFSTIKFEVYGTRSIDGGLSFNTPFLIESGGSRNLFTTAAVNDGAGRTYLAYESCESGDCQIELFRSEDDFNTFKRVGTASQGQIFSIKPAISALPNGEVYVAMTTALSATDSRFEIFYASSRDFAATFTLSRNVSNTPDQSNNPTLVTVGGTLYLAWLDKTPGNLDVFLSESRDGGASFSTPFNVTSNNTVSQSPHLAVSPTGSILMVFQDEVDGNDEVYSVVLRGEDRRPSVTGLDPDNGPVGTVVKIVGRDLLSTSRVTIGGQDAEFFVVSNTEITAIVPKNARAGKVNVTTAGGSSEDVDFKLSANISVGPAVLDFGSAQSGEVVEAKVVRIRNLGTGQLRVTGAAITGTSFLLDSTPSFPVSISAGGVLPLRVRFLPGGASPSEGSLNVTSDDALQSSLTVRLKGQTSGIALQLKAPQGGEKLKGGQIFVIEWEATQAEQLTFDLSLSTDGGRTFDRPIASGLTGFNRSFTWTVPSVKSKTARVQIIGRAADGRIFIDQSRANFRIKR